MKIVILRSAEADLRWYHHYYESIFPEGRSNGRARFVAATRVLLQNPFAGQPAEVAPCRKFAITGTPFHFLYRVAGKQIQVLQIKDGRSKPDRLPETPDET